jgi:putative ABC transport system permease protein
MTTLIQDVRYGLRMLAKNPGFAAVVVVTLALGIGANTAIFSVVDAVLLRPLPYADPGRLVVVGERWMGGGGDFSPPDYLDIAAQNHVFEQMAAYRNSNFNLSAGKHPERVWGAVVTINTFNLLGVKPLLGRSFMSGDGGRGGNRTAVLSYGLWQARLGGRLGVIGEKISLDDQPYIVVGVMPNGFGFPDSAQLWVPPRFAVPEHPLRPDVDPATMPGSHYFDSLARLRPGVRVTQAREDVDAVIRHIAERRDTEARDGAWIETLHESQVGDLRPALLVLLGAVGLVLLIACANVGNLLLARGAGRQKEMAIRGALGAGRAALLRQLLTESLLLAILGGALAILFASWGARPLASLVPQDLRSFIRPGVDARVLAFTALASLAAALFFGLTPAFEGSRIGLSEALKEGGQSTTPGRHRVQRILVVAESALAVILLVGAGLLVKSFLGLLRVNEGFDPTHVMTLNLALPAARYSEPLKRTLFVKRVLDGIAALPGVRSASVVTRLPLGGGDSHRGIEIEGRPSRPHEDLSILYSVTAPGYFRTLGIPLLRGRDFTERDDAAAPGVIIINQVMARKFWPGVDPVGKRVKVNDKFWEVVGVVGDTRQHDLGETVEPMFYTSYAQDAWPFLTVVVRAAGDPSSIATEAETAIHTVDKEQAVYTVRTMSEVVETSVSPRRFYMLLLGLFAVLALALAAVGVFGVISFAVAQRTHEIGVRMALGARQTDVLKLMVGEGFKLALMGVGIGVLGALVLTRFLTTVLYGVKPTDPLVYLAVSLILTAVALLASYIPARRATKVDPMVALREL